MNDEDICYWPDDTWCFYSEIEEMHFMSDDYRIAKEGTPKWFEILGEDPNDPAYVDL